MEHLNCLRCQDKMISMISQILSKTLQMLCSSAIWAYITTWFILITDFSVLWPTGRRPGGRGGRGVLPYISYMGMCRTLGYGFRAVLVWNRVCLLPFFAFLVWNRAWLQIYGYRFSGSDLKRGMKNHIFCYEIGSEFWEPCGTPPPKFWGVPPPLLNNHTFNWQSRKFAYLADVVTNLVVNKYSNKIPAGAEMTWVLLVHPF